MLDSDTPPRNAFQETLVGLEYSPRPEREADLFSQACVEQYQACDPTRYGYRFAQVFEANVLTEVALLEGVDLTSLADLSHHPTHGTAELAERVDRVSELSVVEAVNTAAALISISRFSLAARALGHARVHADTQRCMFEVWMLMFVVANRCDDGRGSAEAFAGMRVAIDSGSLPPDRVLDACSQAVVWFLKRRELSEEDFHWYVRTGRELAKDRKGIDSGTLSAWYRALAMVPAAQGRADLTRRYMEYTRETAELSMCRRPGAYENHLLKTYHESTLKEHMYVTRDPVRAEETGRALIALDPAWSPSYGEVAEAHLRFNAPERAATMYEKAVEMGPPYYGHHLLQAARTWERCGEHERALVHYGRLADLVPENVEVLRSGLQLARQSSHASRDQFEDLLAQAKAVSSEHV